MTPQRPLLLIALKQEARPIAMACRKAGFMWRRDRAGSVLTVGDDEFDVVLTGPGQRGIEPLLREHRPSEIIQPGFAGALREDMHRGDIFVVESVRFATEVLDVPLSPRITDHRSLASMNRAALVTAPAPLNARDKATMNAHAAGDLVDMESFAAARYCKSARIPYTGLRVVTDELADDIPQEILDAYEEGVGFRVLPLVWKALTSRAARRRLLELRSNADLAGRLLADAVVRAFSGG